MDQKDIDSFLWFIDKTIDYRDKHLSQFTWGPRKSVVDHQEYVVWFFDILLEHLLSIQALSKTARFPRYAHSLIVISRSMLEGTAILNWLCDEKESEAIYKAEIFKNYINFKGLIEAKNNDHALNKQQERFIDRNRHFLMEDDIENNKIIRSKKISEIKNNDVYREFYRATNSGLNIGTLISQISQKLCIENHLGAFYHACSEIAHFNPMALRRYIIRKPKTLYFDSGNLDLIGTSLLLAIICVSFSIDMLSCAFKLDISEFRTLAESIKKY